MNDVIKVTKRKNSTARFLKRAKNLIKLKYKMSLIINPADAIVIAGLHATIFSIIIGFISAYALYIYSKVNEMEAQVFQEASKINSVQFNGQFSSKPGALNYDTSDKNKRKDALEQLKKLGMGFSSYNGSNLALKGEETIKPLPTTSLERGQDALAILSALFTHYPFATELLDFSGSEPSKPIEFNNIEKVRTWANDVESTLRPILWTLTVHSKTHQDNFGEVEKSLAERFNSKPEKSNSMFYKFQVQDYLQTAFSAREVVRTVKSQLAQIDARKPNKRIIISGLIISFIGIIFGVMFPMINKETQSIYFLWIPIACYLILFSYIIISLSEQN